MCVAADALRINAIPAEAFSQEALMGNDYGDYGSGNDYRITIFVTFILGFMGMVGASWIWYTGHSHHF